MPQVDRQSRNYVGALNFLPEVRADDELADNIELVEITLREEVVYDVNLTVNQKVMLAKSLDAMNIPVIQMHSQGVGDVIKACRDAGVRAKFEALSRPYYSYGYGNWRTEIIAGVKAGADIIRPSVTAPAKWAKGDPGMKAEGVASRALDCIKFAFDQGAKLVSIGFTDATRQDFGFLTDMAAKCAEHGASTIVLNDSVGVARPSLIKHMVRTLRKATGVGVRVHCHNDFGLGTANTLAALEAGATGAEVVVNGADPARSGIAPLAEVVIALLCLYRKEIGIVTENLTEASLLFADMSGIPLAEQKPIVADRNWMYKRDHLISFKEEKLQFPFSPSLVGQKFRIGMGRGSGALGVKAKLSELGIEISEQLIPQIVARVNEEAAQKKRRLTDEEFRYLVLALR